jgi:hypothetical protein
LVLHVAPEVHPVPAPPVDRDHQRPRSVIKIQTDIAGPFKELCHTRGTTVADEVRRFMVRELRRRGIERGAMSR